MTYYEELGISANATVEEIRQAYKRLARLLHPDKLQNEKQRHVAECQMKRLNGVYETLVHPESRMAYDESLRAALFAAQPLDEEIAPEPEKSIWMDLPRRLKGPTGVWAGAGALGLLLLLWILADTVRTPEASVIHGPRREAAIRETAARNEMPLPDPRLLQLRQRLAQMRRERDEALERARALSRELTELQRRGPPMPTAPAVESIPASAQPALPPAREPSHGPNGCLPRGGTRPGGALVLHKVLGACRARPVSAGIYRGRYSGRKRHSAGTLPRAIPRSRSRHLTRGRIRVQRQKRRRRRAVALVRGGRGKR